MVVYYAALGHAAIVRQPGREPQPAVIRGDQDYHVMPEEMLLWSLIYGHICHTKELNEIYDKESAAIAAGGRSVLSFKECLSRLLQRRLIMSGSGYSGEAALYELLCNTVLIPIHISPLQKLTGFFHLTFFKRYPLRITIHLFDRQKFSQDERCVWQLINRYRLSTAEVIAELISPTDKKAALMAGSSFDNNSAAAFTSLKNRALVAAANLYNRRLLILDIL